MRQHLQLAMVAVVGVAVGLLVAGTSAATLVCSPSFSLARS